MDCLQNMISLAAIITADAYTQLAFTGRRKVYGDVYGKLVGGLPNKDSLLATIVRPYSWLSCFHKNRENT